MRSLTVPRMLCPLTAGNTTGLLPLLSTLPLVLCLSCQTTRGILRAIWPAVLLPARWDTPVAIRIIPMMPVAILSQSFALPRAAKNALIDCSPGTALGMLVSLPGTRRWPGTFPWPRPIPRRLCC